MRGPSSSIYGSRIKPYIVEAPGAERTHCMLQVASACLHHSGNFPSTTFMMRERRQRLERPCFCALGNVPRAMSR